MIRLFHKHRYDLRETIGNERYLVCRCGARRPMISRKEPLKFPVTPPSHEQLKARRQNALLASQD